MRGGRQFIEVRIMWQLIRFIRPRRRLALIRLFGTVGGIVLLDELVCLHNEQNTDAENQSVQPLNKAYGLYAQHSLHDRQIHAQNM